MHRLEKKLGLLLYMTIVFFWLPLQGQSISGFVLDKQTKAPLVFAHIRINNTTKGTNTNLDGKFSLDAQIGDSLYITYLGYEPFIYNISTLRELVYIELEQSPTNLQEIEIKPRENPAWRIIRQALSMRKYNSPLQYKNYSYTSYNKSIFHVSNISTDVGHNLINIEPDSLHNESALFKKAYLWLKESIVQTTKAQPDLLKEEIIASKSSMPGDIIGGLSPTDFQPLGFYKEVIHIDLLGKSYINPLSTGCFDRYDFRLEQTIFHDQDTTYVIAFRPLPHKNFLGFQGAMSINSSGYAIENVIATTADSSDIIHLKLQQQYQKIEKKWFPSTLQTELKCVLEDGKGGHSLLWVRNRSFLSKISIDSNLAKNAFSYITRTQQQKANLQADSILQEYRKEPLSSSETQTYEIWDTSTSIKLMRDVLKIYNQGILRPLTTGKITKGPIEFLINDFIKVNRYEKLRIGLGLQTHFSKDEKITIGGNIGYGFGDQSLKYGLFTMFRLIQKNDLKFRISYKQDLEEPGAPSLLSNTYGLGRWLQPRNAFRYRFDSVETLRGDFFWRPRQGWQFNPFFQYEHRRIMAYQNIAELGSPAYLTRAAGINLRWAPHEKISKIETTEALLAQSFPVLDLQLSHYWFQKPLYDHFTRIHLNLDHRIFSKAMGMSRIRISAGKIWGEAPYPYLFNMPGSFVDDRSTILMPRTFQTAGLYEFIGEHFFAFFWEQHFNELLFKIQSPFFRPRLSIFQNIGYSKIGNRTLPLNIDYNTMQNGFYESGLSIRDFIRIPLKSIGGYLTGTVGAFMRWGSYQKPDFSDNVVYRFTIGYAPKEYNSYKAKPKRR